MRISIKYKVFLANLAVLLVFAFGMIGISVYFIGDTYRKNYQLNSLRIAGMIASFSSVIRNEAKLREFLASSMDLSVLAGGIDQGEFMESIKDVKRDLVFLIVTDPQDTPVFFYTNREFSAVIKTTGMSGDRAEIREDVKKLLTRKLLSDEPMAQLSKAVILNNGQKIIIVFSELTMIQKTWNVIWTILTFSGLLLAASCWTNLNISEKITYPLKYLGRKMKLVSERDFKTRAEVLSRDEIGELTVCFNEMVAGLEEKEKIKNIFERYVTKQVADAILNGKIKVNLSGEKRNVTILFCDIRNFTSMSEKLPPEDVVAFLNDYFSVMLSYIFKYNGMLDKFVGDAIMAVFGTPDEDAEHAVNAVRAAIGMKEGLARINQKRLGEGRPAINIGIGINSGMVVAGNIGAIEKMEYTVIGDEVNLASRLEGLTKEYEKSIIISEATAEIVKSKFNTTFLASVHVKGKEKIVNIYTVE